jgi:serine phosphatase RsbU (regulator of sigma subunit)
MKLGFKWGQRESVSNGATHAELPELSGADIAGLVDGRRVGGDFYQFARANDERVVFGLLDVAGRADENRGIVDAARETFRSKAPECLGRDEINEADAMMEFCQALNSSIRSAAKGVRSCAAFLGCYNESLGTVCYVNAGHTAGLLRHNSDVSELVATGMPLGLFSASTYEAPIAAVPAGGGLLLVSRGVVEAANRKQEFGLQRVTDCFRECSLNSARGAAQAMLDAVRAYAPAAAEQNDLTALALVRPRKVSTA